MIRRSGWHYYAPDRGDIAEQVSLWMAEELKWAPEIRERELENYLHQQCRAPETVGCSRT
jgi:hypothetical protein